MGRAINKPLHPGPPRVWEASKTSPPLAQRRRRSTRTPPTPKSEGTKRPDEEQRDRCHDDCCRAAPKAAGRGRRVRPLGLHALGERPLLRAERLQVALRFTTTNQPRPRAQAPLLCGVYLSSTVGENYVSLTLLEFGTAARAGAMTANHDRLHRSALP